MELDFPIATLDTRKQQEQYPKNSGGKLFRNLKCIPKVSTKVQNKRKIPSEGWGFKNWLPVHPFLRNNCRASLRVQWLRLHASTAGDVGSVSGQRTKILTAAQCGQGIPHGNKENDQDSGRHRSQKIWEFNRNMESEIPKTVFQLCGKYQEQQVQKSPRF